MIRPEDGGRPQTERPGTAYRQKQEPHLPHFDLRVSRADTLTHIELFGELDLSCEDRFGDVVDAIHTGRLVLDLRGLTFIDSTGLRMILRTWQRSQQDGFALEIVRGRDQVERVFQLTGVDDALPMADEVSLNGHSALQESVKRNPRQTA